MFTATRRRVLDGLNRRYIYGRLVSRVPRVPSLFDRHSLFPLRTG